MRRLGVVVALVVVVSVLAACSDADDEAVFSFADHDLCEWVTEEEVADFVAAEFNWDGTAVEIEPGQYERAACMWVLTHEATDDTGLVVANEAGNRGRIGGGLGFPEIAEAEVVDFAEAGYPDIGSSVTGHPSLSEGVAVYIGGFGQTTFWVPPKSDYLALLLQVPGAPDESEDWWLPTWAVGDHFIEELGWLSEQ